jgi:predicted dinucleotide-binding enzyme
MKIGVLGSGTVGKVLGEGLLRHGHQVVMGTRSPNGESAQKWVAQTPGASAQTFAEAAKFGELVILAVLGRVVDEVIRLAGPENLAGKAVMDATNPIADAPPVKGVLQFSTGPNQSLAEQIQAMAPQAHIVKAFNSVGAARMVNPKFEQGPPTMFYCGDDESAKGQVADIIRQFGWEPFDCGALIAARAIEPLCMLWCIPGFLSNRWTHAFKLLTK